MSRLKILGLILASALTLGACSKTNPVPSQTSQNSQTGNQVPSSNSEQTAAGAVETGSQELAGPHYVEYSPAAFAAAADKRRVYFFHAVWCPTCKVLNRDLLENAGRLPEDVVVFRTDYDREVELKRQYGVTYQHTLVQVDADGNEVAKWNGGGIDEIIENVR